MDALHNFNQMVVLADAKELGHLFLEAGIGKDGHTTCTFDHVPFERKSVFNLVTQHTGIDVW